MGVKALRELPDVKVVEEENVPETDAVSKTMESMINLDGAKLILPTSFGYWSPFVLYEAKANPGVQFRHAAPLRKQGDPKNSGSYFHFLDQVAAFRKACLDNRIWGCFSIMEFNQDGNPYNVGLVIDDHGDVKLYYRKMHPWVPVEPWEPGDRGIPVIDGPNGCRLGLIICHDGMFPDMARECAYKGAEIMLRTAGYTAPIRESWRFTNQSNSFCNLMVTANVCMSGSDGSFDSMGEGMVVDFDGTIVAHGTGGRPDEIITAEVRPDLVREARIHWGVENNIYQLGHRGYTAVKGGAQDCPYTYMQDLAAGRYRVPWEDDVKQKDGSSSGFAVPTRSYGAGQQTGGDRKQAAE